MNALAHAVATQLVVSALSWTLISPESAQSQPKKLGDCRLSIVGWRLPLYEVAKSRAMLVITTTVVK